MFDLFYFHKLFNTLEALNQTRFSAQTLCGLRGGLPFSQVQRVDPYTQSCPDDTFPCATISPENTICYPQDKIDVQCPITSIKFIPYSQYADPTWTNIPFNNDYKLIYSKTQDSLPITKTSISQQPCLDPTHHNDGFLGKSLEYYPTELDRLKYLETDHSLPLCEDKSLQDPRYIKAGMSISEYDMQAQSGVLSTLEDLPGSESFVDLNLRKSKILDFWTRPTIPWKLSCEQTISRSQVLEQITIGKLKILSIKYEGFSDSVVADLIWLSVWIIIISLCCGGCCLFYKTPWKRYVPISCFIIWTGCKIAAAFVSAQIAGLYASIDSKKKHSLYRIADVLGDCSDEQTRVSEAMLYGAQSKANAVKSLMLAILAILVLKMTGFCYFFSIELYQRTRKWYREKVQVNDHQQNDIN